MTMQQIQDPIKVLVIDDDEDDFLIISDFISDIPQGKFETIWCNGYAKALKLIAQKEHDIYFIDYRLGIQTGIDLVKQAIAMQCEEPLILLTGKGNTYIDREAMKFGATDYLIKGDLNTEILERSLRYALERFKSFKLINDNEKKYRLLFENAISFIFTCDANLNFTECNPASHYLLGETPEELKNKSLLDYISDKDKQIVKDLLADKKNIGNLGVELINHTGSVAGNLSITYFDLPNAKSYWQGIILDETIRNQAEQAKIQKEKLDATYRLVRTLAHEIRNPLTNIGLSLEGIEEKNIDGQKMFIDIIKRSSSRINNIISELLQSSKTVELRLELIDIVEVVKDAIEIADDRIKLKNIIVETSFPDYKIVKEIDIEKITISLINLIVNAVEAMEANTGKLCVHILHNIDATQIVIKDTGSGISETNLKNLFEPYFTTKKTGMGLGLASTLNIIKSHKADIKVESKENVGTTFTIVFPNN